MLGVAFGGFGILVALGVLIGYALDRRARDDAWRRIAAARQINAHHARELDEQQIQLQDIEDALTARARRLESRDPPASGFPTDWPVVRIVEPPVDLPDSAA